MELTQREHRDRARLDLATSPRRPSASRTCASSRSTSASATRRFRDYVELGPEEFYERLRGGSELPTTSQPTPQDFLDAYEELVGLRADLLAAPLRASSPARSSPRSLAAEQTGATASASSTRRPRRSRSRMLALAMQRRLERGTTRRGDRSARRVVQARRRRRSSPSGTLEYLQKGGRIGARPGAGRRAPERQADPLDRGRRGRCRQARPRHGRRRSASSRAFRRATRGPAGPAGRDRARRRAGVGRRDRGARADARGRRPRSSSSRSLGAVVGTHAGPGTVGFFWFAGRVTAWSDVGTQRRPRCATQGSTAGSSTTSAGRTRSPPPRGRSTRSARRPGAGSGSCRAEGEPVALVSALEAARSRRARPARRLSRLARSRGGARASCSLGRRRVAMEVSPRAAVPVVGRVDWGTVELVRSFGVDVVSSGDLVQLFEARWTPTRRALHERAATGVLAREGQRSCAGCGDAARRSDRSRSCAGVPGRDGCAAARPGDAIPAVRRGRRPRGRPALRDRDRAPTTATIGPARSCSSTLWGKLAREPRRRLRRHHLDGLDRGSEPPERRRHEVWTVVRRRSRRRDRRRSRGGRARGRRVPRLRGRPGRRGLIEAARPRRAHRSTGRATASGPRCTGTASTWTTSRRGTTACVVARPRVHGRAGRLLRTGDFGVRSEVERVRRAGTRRRVDDRGRSAPRPAP